MLDKITYLGHEIVQSSFSSRKPLQRKTVYQYHIDLPEEFSFIEIFSVDQVHLHNELSMVLNTLVEGLEPDLSTQVFTLEIQFIIRFKLDSTQFMKKQHIANHLDFFMAFADQSAQSIINSVLTYNAINCTVQPVQLICSNRRKSEKFGDNFQ